MKLPSPIPCARSQTGYLLMECLVYISVFAIITGMGLATFYLCWENSRGLRYTTDDVSAALHAGERWRADIRSATGTITVEHTADGELLRIPSGTNSILYRFTAGKIQRQSSSSRFAEPVLTSVGASQMVMDHRGPINSWRWELVLQPHREAPPLPLQFTFEAVTKPAS